jgi:NAD(P)-dependent dehydrogenase (short-subunit alcohol dehydrogenase family)
MSTSSNVWLVTGSGSGLGRNIAEAVLADGHRLVATARDPRRLEDLVNKYGDQIRTAPLDVTDEKAAQASVQIAVEAFGRLDVVVISNQVRPLTVDSATGELSCGLLGCDFTMRETCIGDC